MKTRILSLISLILLGTATVFAGNKTEKILVNGKCEMCEKRIEMAALSDKGVSKADWNKETKELSVTLDESKTSITNVNEAINKVGHDTNLSRATDDAYSKLPDCCKYDRSDLKKPEKTTTKKHK